MLNKNIMFLEKEAKINDRRSLFAEWALEVML